MTTLGKYLAAASNRQVLYLDHGRDEAAAWVLVPEGAAPYRTAETDRYSLNITPLSGAPFSEAEYLAFWKSWWATMQDKVMAHGQ